MKGTRILMKAGVVLPLPGGGTITYSPGHYYLVEDELAEAWIADGTAEDADAPGSDPATTVEE